MAFIYLFFHRSQKAWAVITVIKKIKNIKQLSSYDLYFFTMRGLSGPNIGRGRQNTENLSGFNDVGGPPLMRIILETAVFLSDAITVTNEAPYECPTKMFRFP